MHLINVVWEGFNPRLITDGGVIEIKEGLKLSYTKGKRMCIGIKKNLDELKPCPGKNEATVGEQCKFCARSDRLNPCIRCNGLSCNGISSTRNFCINNSFCTYLVNFGDIIKVGVSYEKRLLKRWVEQGADNGIVISKGNGKQVRLKELELSKKYPDKVFIENKVLELQKEINPINGVKLRDCYPGINNVHKFVNKKLEELKGEVMCVKGPLLILDCGWVNLKEFMGYEIT